MRLKNFLKKYGYFVIAGSLIVAIGVVAGLGETRANTNINVPTQSDVLEFGLPMNNAEVVKGYSDTELMFNETLNQWESHKAVDIVSNTSDNVYAVLDGTVTKVDENYEEGTLIEITHANGLVSRYLNLGSDIKVTVNQTVKKGTLLGVVSTTSANECKECKHLHFEMLKNGKKVDPANYLTLENK